MCVLIPSDAVNKKPLQSLIWMVCKIAFCTDRSAQPLDSNLEGNYMRVIFWVESAREEWEEKAKARKKKPNKESQLQELNYIPVVS